MKLDKYDGRIVDTDDPIKENIGVLRGDHRGRHLAVIGKSIDMMDIVDIIKNTCGIEE